MIQERFRRIELYTTARYLYAIGTTDAPTGNKYRVLQFDRKTRTRDIIQEDPRTFTKDTVEAYLASVKYSNQSTGGLVFIGSYAGLAGMVRFFKGYYLVMITSGIEIGIIGENVVYTCGGSELVPIFDSSNRDDITGRQSNTSAFSRGWSSIFNSSQEPHDSLEEEYANLFRNVDLTKQFYWSYSYNLYQSLQTNVAENFRASSGLPRGPDTHFIWNHYIATVFMRNFVDAEKHDPCSCPWLIQLIHGYYRQQRCTLLSRSFTITIVARRSRHYAGTRFLKRGVNDGGYAANEVEVEQIFQDHSLGSDSKGGISSYLQVRGSIPVFWSQETSVASPKPAIKMTRYDPFYNATRLHFMDLMRRYGTHIVALNLVKLKEKYGRREVIVGKNYKQAVGQLNTWLPPSLGIEYRAVDFTRLSKIDPSSLLYAIDLVVSQALAASSMFVGSVNGIREFAPNPCERETLDAMAKRQRVENSCLRSNPVTSPLALSYAKRPQRWSQVRHMFKPMKMNMLGQDLECASTGKPPDRFSLNNREPSGLDLHRKPSRVSQHQYLDVDDFNDDGEDSQDGEFDEDSQSIMSEALDDDEDEVSRLRTVLGQVPQQQDPRIPRQSLASASMQQKRSEDVQTGIIRTNCIDCLDRTNLAQFLIGLRALNMQMYRAGLMNAEDRLETDSPVSVVLMDLYEEMGDKISHQYGGSDAVKKNQVVSSGGGGRQQAIYAAVKRYYTNNFTDSGKQDGINVFLGLYRPRHFLKQQESSGERKGDFYLHNKIVSTHPNSMSNYAMTTNWWSSCVEDFQGHVLLPLRALRACIRNHKSVMKISRPVSDCLCMFTSFQPYISNPRFTTRDIAIPPSDEVYKRRSLVAKSLSENSFEVIMPEALPIDEFTDTARLQNEIDPAIQSYARQSEDPSSLFEFSSDEPSTAERQKQQEEFTKSLGDYTLSENDAWGMRRLQAYAGATTNLLHGTYQGFPHALPAVVVVNQATVPLASPKNVSRKMVRQTV